MSEESTRAPRRRQNGDLELVIFDGPAMRRVPLTTEPITIGRGEEASIRVDDPSVSRVHARFVGGPSPTVEDLDSSNGVVIGGKAQKSHPLAANTVIVLGELQVVVREARALEQPPPPSLPEGSMAAVQRLIELVAPSELSVLVLGETGVGKEIVSRAIHDRSKRKDGPLLVLNCAALPEHTLESEVFGHEKGAFTGAIASKPGLLEAASGGTVLLDEVGEMPLSVQAKLLRALDVREIVRLGAVRPRAIDVRVIAATNRDLTAMVEEGTFRSDLLYRLDGMTIHIPPLRDRRNEIRPLATQFAGKVQITPEAMAVLEAHKWPGNVRELKKVIERAVVLATGKPIEKDHIMLRSASSAGSVAPPAAKQDLQSERERAEIEAIQEALATCQGNQTRAAEKLGISRRTLIERLDKYNLPRPRKS